MGQVAAGPADHSLPLPAHPPARGPEHPGHVLNVALRRLADRGALFIGQGVGFDGISMYHDLEGVPGSQRLEFPVAEELNVGFATGLALMGYLPVVQIPRIDFLMRAMDQLVNHLDKMEAMSRGQWCPKVIIRTRIGSKVPLDAGPQHTQDHGHALRSMLTNVNVWYAHADNVADTYDRAFRSPRSSLVIEAL